MTDDEDDLRTGLRAIGQDYDPAGLDDIRAAVQRRGRRALLVRRAGAVAAVVAVIGGVGAGVAAVDTLTSGPGHVPAASGLQRGHDGVTPLPGWVLVVPKDGEVPVCEATTVEPEVSRAPTSAAPNTTADVPEPPAPGATVAPNEVPDGPVEAAVRSVVDGAAVEVLLRQTRPSGEMPTQVGLRVSAPEGRGSVQVDVGVFQGTPAREADRDVARDDGCGAVLRRQTDEGAVLLLHKAQREPGERELRLYRPDGTRYVVTVVGDVPTESQLAHIGERLATRSGRP